MAVHKCWAVACASLIVSGLACLATAAERKLDFDHDIMPLLKSRCIKCHGPASQEGSLNLSTPAAVMRGGESGATVVAGDLDASEIWKRVSAHDMPPGDPLTEDEQALVRTWITQGAGGLPAAEKALNSEPDHWSFRPLQSVAVPDVNKESLCRTDIDRFLLAALEERGLAFGAEADRSTLIRRVSFDLTGLPPTAEEIAAYLADSSEHAYKHMVERYLGSPRYGERWGKHWLDIAGYADSNGYFDSDTDRPLAYRYRDYVIRSFNKDKPFDQFIREQLAGDELAGLADGEKPTATSIELLEATHFLRNAEDGTADSGENMDEAMRDRRAVLDATVEIFGSALFGLTLQCARCHDHKFEPVTQRDYYALQAVLAPAFDIDHWVIPSERYVMAERSSEQAAAAQVAVLGGTLIPDISNRIAAVRDLSPSPPEVRILERGEPKLPGAKVSPAGPTILNSLDNVFSDSASKPHGQSTGYRLAFAQWMTRARGKPSSLLARVHVNRIWQRYFDKGLVTTPTNFGYSGERPTHPELIEWLAGQFVDAGWSTKAVHRLILNSAAYRQTSALNAQAHRIDPENRLLWRMPLRRLDAESLYDALLSVSGELDTTMGGPATQTLRIDLGEVVVAEAFPGAHRRSIYLQQKRTQIPTLLQAFDAPALVTNCVQRQPSTVPMQSLVLLNSDFMLLRAANLAKRVAREAGDDSGERIERAFLLTLGREPDIEELRASLQFMRKQTIQYKDGSPIPLRHAWTDFCHSLIASNAFLYIE